MAANAEVFFSAVITAGAVLSGFCGTFLTFRIQREANYYGQVAPSYQEARTKDIAIELTHFTTSFLLLILAALCSVIFGFLIPLLALAASAWALKQSALVAAGLIATLIFVTAYFVAELVHYRIVSTHLMNDLREWRREWLIVAVGVGLALVTAGVAFTTLSGPKKAEGRKWTALRSLSRFPHWRELGWTLMKTLGPVSYHAVEQR